MIKTEFRAHPLMIFFFIKPYIFVLVLPFIREFIQYIKNGETSGLLMLAFAPFVFVVFIAIVRWKALKIIIKDQSIVIEKGFVVKTTTIISLSNVSSVILKRNAADLVFRSATVDINTEAGSPKKSDFRIKIRAKEAVWLHNYIYDDKTQSTIKFSIRRMFLLAAGTSSIVSGVALGAIIIKSATQFLNIALSDVIIKKINDIAFNIETAFETVVNVAMIVLIVGYGVALVISFLKSVNFRLEDRETSIRIESGAIVRKQTSFKKSAINNICCEQTPIMRALKKYSVRLSVAGYGNGRANNSVVVPMASKDELKNQFAKYWPAFKTKTSQITPNHNKSILNKFLRVPVILGLIIIGFGLFCALWYVKFSQTILLLMVILLCADGYCANLCYHNYKRSCLCVDKWVCAEGTSVFKVRRLYCDKTKVGIIKISQTPIDRRLNICKVKITIRSEAADNVKIKNLDAKSVKDVLAKQFNLNFME